MTDNSENNIVRAAARRARGAARGNSALINTPAPELPVALDDLLRRAARTARRSRAENTKRAYGGVLRAFGAFAASQEQAAFPAGAHTVAAFLQHRIDSGVSPASLNVAMTALRIVHQENGQPDPTADPAVRAIVKGYRRMRAAEGVETKQARAMSESDLAAIVAVAARDDDIRAIRDIAIISVLREGLLRRAECAALRVRHFSREPDGSGRIQITRSKTDQSGEGRILFLGEQAAGALSDWMSRAPADAPAPLFRRIRRGGKIQPDGLTGHAINAIMQARGKAAGLAGFTGHSGRVGMAQSLVADGASVGEVAVAGRWSSLKMVVHYAGRQAAAQGAVARYRKWG